MYNYLCSLYDTGNERMDGLEEGHHSYFQFRMFACTLYENIAYLVVNYYAQVTNGGHMQWFENGYREEAELLKMALKKINGEHSLHTIELINGALAICPSNLDSIDGKEYDLIDEALNPLDIRFYEYADSLIGEVGSWIQEKIGAVDLEEKRWYVKDDEGKMFGPFDKRNAEQTADEINAIIVQI